MAVAIIAVLNSGKEVDNNSTATGSYTSDVAGDNMNATEDTNGQALIQNQEKSTNSEEQKKTEIKGVKILINKKEIAYPVSAFVVEDLVCISADKVLPSMNYKECVVADYNKNRIRFDHKKPREQ